MTDLLTQKNTERKNFQPKKICQTPPSHILRVPPWGIHALSSPTSCTSSIPLSPYLLHPSPTSPLLKVQLFEVMGRKTVALDNKTDKVTQGWNLFFFLLVIRVYIFNKYARLESIFFFFWSLGFTYLTNTPQDLILSTANSRPRLSSSQL